MAHKNKVVWTEGLFVRPQHFQQQERYIERLVSENLHSTRTHAWGLTELEMDPDVLSVGKFGLRNAKGYFQDGTPFDAPNEDLLPEPLTITEDIREVVVYLGIPMARAHGLDSITHEKAGDVDEIVRFRQQDLDVRDTTSDGQLSAMLQVAPLGLKLLLASQLSDDYLVFPVAKIRECRADNQVVLTDDFIPSVMRFSASSRLAGMVTELKGMLTQRADGLAARAVASGRGGTGEIGDFLKLQVLNRAEVLFGDLIDQDCAHPHDLYRDVIALCGELATFGTGRRAPEFHGYRHDDLWACFHPTMAIYRQLMSDTDQQSAVSLPLEAKGYGIRVATLSDKSLLANAAFVLAVAADVSDDQLRGNFPNLLKVAPVERISELVNAQIPGIAIAVLPVTPRQIPYHAGFMYFEIQRGGQLWDMLSSSAGFAFHVAAELPGLELEFWAIRSGS